MRVGVPRERWSLERGGGEDDHQSNEARSRHRCKEDAVRKVRSLV